MEKFIGKKMLIFTDVNNLILCFGLIIGYQKYIYQFLIDILKNYISYFLKIDLKKEIVLWKDQNEKINLFIFLTIFIPVFFIELITS